MTSNINKEKIEGDMGKFDLKNSLGAFTDRLSQAEFMQQTHPIIYDKSRNYWAWGDGDKSYHRVDEVDILIAIKNTTSDRSLIEHTAKNMIMESIRMTGRERKVEDLPPNYIQFKNCVVDVLTGDEFQATPDIMFTSPIPHNLGESEETPYIDKLFGEWVGEEEKIKLYEILAYSLYQGYPINRIFALYGDGRNGKSQYIKIINAFIGMENTTTTSLDLITTSRFETAKLYKKRAAFVSETDSAIMRKTAMLKKLSGDDMVGGEFKGKDTFDFWNHAKIIIATNNLPESDDKTEGFYSRWIVLDFFNKFDEGRGVMDAITEEEYENLGRKLIRILADLLKRGKFTREGTIRDKKKKYEEKSTPIKHFIDEKCVRGVDEKMMFHKFYKELEEWMDGRRYRKMETRTVTKWLRENGHESKWERWSGYGDKKYLTFFGLRFRNDEELEDSGSQGSEGSGVLLTPHTHEEVNGSTLPSLPTLPGEKTQPPSKLDDFDANTADRIRKALSVALQQNHHDGCDVKEITHLTRGLSRSTVHRYLTTYADKMNIEKSEDGLYRLRSE